MKINERINISLNCIAKNESLHIKKAIESVIDKVKEIVFIDHNSMDNTYDIVFELSKKYDNLKIINLDKNEKLSHASVRNLAIENSSCDYIFKYDGDFMFLDESYEILNKYINIMDNDNNIGGVSFSYWNLMYDNNNIYDSKRNEIYLFRKHSCGYVVSDKYADNMNLLKNTKIIYDGSKIFIHANNAKPIINLLFRSSMSKYGVSSYYGKISYFEWLFFINMKRNNKDKEELLNFIVNNCSKLLINYKIDNTLLYNTDQNLKKYFSYIDDNIKVDINDGNITYIDTIIIKTKTDLIKLSDNKWKSKLYDVLSYLYDNGELMDF